MSFTKVLVANRGEIAVRILRTARALGYRTVAVYSDADVEAPHVAMADEAVPIGAADPSASYLRIDAVIDAARRTGADAIHPGYGFLAENAAFAEATVDAGMVWIGPPPAAMRAMSSKAAAKTRMIEAGVPTVPGFVGDHPSDAELRAAAADVGYPLLVKAVGGGGGRGMRLVRSAEGLGDAIVGARREAASAFGDGRLMLEAFVDDARHIEIQVFADTHGAVIHLGERDCTTQRRRQKVIEEAPSPAVDEALRTRMGSDAVRAAQAIGYIGAGTVEMLLGRDGRYYFLEMNTRLQVEHPVTELVTGQDLVAWQLRVAAGAPLPLTQDAVARHGHAIEARLYAEDPYAGFAPQAGRIAWFRPDAVADWPGVRIDAGVAEGGAVTPFYDAMVAKVIAHAPTRAEAARKLARALEAVPLVGIATNQRFLVDLLRSDAFLAPTLTTSTLDRWVGEGHPLITRPGATDRGWALAAALLAHGERPWFRTAGPASFTLRLAHRDIVRALTLSRVDDGFTVDGDSVHTVIGVHHRAPGHVRYVHDGVQRDAFALVHDGTVHLDDGAGLMAFREISPWPSSTEVDDPRRITSPVAGTLRTLDVRVGDAVTEGQAVAVVEAMKMETRLVARQAGRVAGVHAAVGDQVEADAVVVEVEVDEGG